MEYVVNVTMGFSIPDLER